MFESIAREIIKDKALTPVTKLVELTMRLFPGISTSDIASTLGITVRSARRCKQTIWDTGVRRLCEADTAVPIADTGVPSGEKTDTGVPKETSDVSLNVTINNPSTELSTDLSTTVDSEVDKSNQQDGELIHLSTDSTTTTTSNTLKPKEKKEIKKKEKKYDPSFLLFWERYPRKEGKNVAYVTWQNKLKTWGDDTQGDIMIGLTSQLMTWNSWPNDQRKYIPMPSTWLNQERWRDFTDGTTNEARPDSVPEVIKPASDLDW